ncbi:hypothetical protein FPRO06_11748 [Fusarium proliferatum]|nr:hypothetical protein FPRO06_11748 [Fusarium proliferatum]
MCNYIYKELSCQHHYHLVESWCPKYIETERRCPPTIVSKQYWGDDICVGSMPRTGQALSPINSDLISTLDATPPASGATPMVICMRGLMTVIRAAYYQATPLGLISREKKKKQPNHIWHGKES